MTSAFVSLRFNKPHLKKICIMIMQKNIGAPLEPRHEKTGFLYPPEKRSFRGVYCFQPFRHKFMKEFILSFRQHFKVLLYNLSRVSPILFKFSPHLNNQTMHV